MDNTNTNTSDQQPAKSVGLRVLHLTLSLAQGGRRQAIFNLIACPTMSAGVQSHLATLGDGSKTPAQAQQIAHSVTHLRRRSVFDRKAVRMLRQLLVAQQIDLVHVHDAASHITAALAMIGLDKALVMTFHRSKSIDSKPWRVRLLCAPANFCSAAIITPSRERADHYQHYHFATRGRVQVIQHGIDTNRFRPNSTQRDALRQELDLPQGTVLFGAVGHFGPEKGIDVVVKASLSAMSRLAAAHNKTAHLAILGAGNEQQQAELKQLAVAANLADQVHFLGFRPDPENFLNALDLMIHGARLEAFGLVLIEALASGCPVIATRSGGAVEVLRGLECGTLVDLDDDQALAERMVELASDDSERERLAELARQTAVDHFSIERCCERHIALYRGALDGKANA